MAVVFDSISFLYPSTVLRTPSLLLMPAHQVEPKNHLLLTAVVWGRTPKGLTSVCFVCLLLPYTSNLCCLMCGSSSSEEALLRIHLVLRSKQTLVAPLRESTASITTVFTRTYSGYLRTWHVLWSTLYRGLHGSSVCCCCSVLSPHHRKES